MPGASTMISVRIGAGLFNLRAAGVWIDDGHVLLQGDAREDFWALPGGRVELMEPAEVALRRELREELAFGEQTEIGRLLWVVQNFFHTPAWGAAHELGLYFPSPRPRPTPRGCAKRRAITPASSRAPR